VPKLIYDFLVETGTGFLSFKGNSFLNILLIVDLFEEIKQFSVFKDETKLKTILPKAQIFNKNKIRLFLELGQEIKTSRFNFSLIAQYMLELQNLIN
jgi:hypothetical protein